MWSSESIYYIYYIFTTFTTFILEFLYKGRQGWRGDPPQHRTTSGAGTKYVLGWLHCFLSHIHVWGCDTLQALFHIFTCYIYIYVRCVVLVHHEWHFFQKYTLPQILIRHGCVSESDWLRGKNYLIIIPHNNLPNYHLL